MCGHCNAEERKEYTMDDFNAEILERAQELADQHKRLGGATVECPGGEGVDLREQIMSDTLPSSAFVDLVDDRYMLHGIHARLCNAYLDEYDNAEEAVLAYGTVMNEIINTLTSYLSQG